MRFLLPTFYIYTIAAVWALRQLTKYSFPTSEEGGVKCLAAAPQRRRPRSTKVHPTRGRNFADHACPAPIAYLICRLTERRCTSSSGFVGLSKLLFRVTVFMFTTTKDES